jgi:hypothetical protein
MNIEDVAGDSLTRQAQMQIMHTCSPPLGLFVPLHQLHVVGG